MITKYKLVGLEKVNNENYIVGICEPIDVEETFQALINGTKQSKEGL